MAKLKAKARNALPPSAKAVAKKSSAGLRSTAKDMASGYTGEARKSLVKEAKRLGKETGPAVTKWVKCAIKGGGTLALIGVTLPLIGVTLPLIGVTLPLIKAFPTAFHWLEAIKPFLHLH